MAVGTANHPLLFETSQTRVGCFRTLRSGGSHDSASAAGEPFRNLPKAKDKGDIFSRRQIGPAIVLYKALRKIHTEERSLAIAEKIVIDSTLIFLRKAVGAISQSRINAMNDVQKQNWLSRIAGQFLNATIRWNHIKVTELSFTITHCHFPVLCRKAGVPELAPIFL